MCCSLDYGYNCYGPFNYVAGYDYYGYDANAYGYYGNHYGGGHFYEQPGRGRFGGTYSILPYIYVVVLHFAYFRGV